MIFSHKKEQLKFAEKVAAGRKSAKLFFALAGFLISSALLADAQFLLMPRNSRGQLLGDAMSATAGSAGIAYNPAGLAFSSQLELELGHSLVSQDISATSLLFTYPFTPYMSVGLFVSSLYLNSPYTASASFVSQNNSITVADSEIGLSLGYAFTPLVGLGLNLRYFRFQLGPEVTQSIGFDLGVQSHFSLPFDPKTGPKKRWSAGLAVRNLGPGFQYYSGGYSESQPFLLRLGVQYRLPRWGNLSVDYLYNVYNHSSFHLGLQILPEFYVSPSFGLQKDFAGWSFSAGGTASVGQNIRLNLAGGTRVGPGSQNTFFSLYLQQPLHLPATTPPPDRFDLHNYYKPYSLQMYSSEYLVEKIQGLRLPPETDEGFSHFKNRLRRVALQADDETIIHKMLLDQISDLDAENRQVSVWLNFKGYSEKPGENKNWPEEAAIFWWEKMASALESEKLELMFGSNLERLNGNQNAPLRAELRLDIELVSEKNYREIRSRLLELYSQTVLTSRTIMLRNQEKPDPAWNEMIAYYQSYLARISGFYHYHLVLPKSL